jgi:hypothetical protein
MRYHQKDNDDTGHLDHMVIDHPDLQRLSRLTGAPIRKAENSKTQHHHRERDG